MLPPPPPGQPDPEVLDTIRSEIKLDHLPREFATALRELLFRNWDVFSKDRYDLGRTQSYQHDVHLTQDKILFRKQFRIPQEHVEYIQNHVQELLKLGAIKRSSSKHNAPIFCVPKPKGRGLRVVIDYRDLNKISKPDYYVAKTVDDCIDIIGASKSKFFSSLDLTSGFHQMPLSPSAQPLTAFSVPGMGSYEWTTAPFGLLGCPASFSRLMDIVMEDLKNVICYLDDTLVHSSSPRQHLQHLQDVFNRLRDHNLKLNPSKCEFLKQNIPYLGFMLSPQGITPDIDKVKIIKQLPPPDSPKKILSFIGMANYFRRHIKGFTFLAQQLTALTRKSAEWKGGALPPNALNAFEALKTALTSAPVMAYPDPKRKFLLTTDAATGDKNGNPGGLGAYLSQMDDNNNERVIAYASRPLQDHEKNYPPFLLEMQAAIFGIEHFYVYLTNRKFTLYTDHKPLIKLSSTHTKTLNRLQQLLLEHDFVLKYRPGRSNTVSDFCSRTAAQVAANRASADSPFELLAMRSDDIHKLQFADPELRALFNYVFHGEPPPAHLDRFVRFHAPQTVLHRKVIFLENGQTTHPVMFVPPALEHDIMQAAHNSQFGGHFSLYKTLRLIRDNYYFPRMHARLERHIAACPECQKAKSNKKGPQSELIPLPQEDGPNFRVHIDLYGPLDSNSHNKYVCVMTDAFTKYVELCAIPNKKAETVARCFFRNWICRHSSPAIIISDGGKEFCNNIMSELLNSFGVQHIRTSPYHPQCNAQAEQFNRTMTRYLRTFTDASTKNWPDLLPALMFSYNTAIHKAVATSPFRLLYNYNPRLPYFDADAPRRIFYGDTPPEKGLEQIARAREAAKAHNMAFRDAYTHLYNRKIDTPSYTPGERVLLHAPHLTSPAANFKLANPWVGPFVVEQSFDNHNVLIRNEASPKQVFRVHFDRVKKFRQVIEHKEIRPEHLSGAANRFSPNSPSDPAEEQEQIYRQVFDGNLIFQADQFLPHHLRSQNPGQASTANNNGTPPVSPTGPGPSTPVETPTAPETTKAKPSSLTRSISKRFTRATAKLQNVGQTFNLALPKRPIEYKIYKTRSAAPANQQQTTPPSPAAPAIDGGRPSSSEAPQASHGSTPPPPAPPRAPPEPSPPPAPAPTPPAPAPDIPSPPTAPDPAAPGP